MAVSTKWAWSLSNPINPEFELNRANRAIASLAILAALVLHVFLVWWLFQQTVVVARPQQPLAVTLVRLPPPVPLPKHVVTPKPLPKPVPKPIPKPVIHPPVPVVHPKLIIRTPPRVEAPRRAAAPPPHVMHFNSNTDNGLGLDLGTPATGTDNGEALMGSYDASVKQAIEAKKTYPPALKGEWNQCVVSYRVTVDRTGQLLSYKLYPCGNPFLDSAALAAILSASPFPVPPNYGGNHYDIYGSLVYSHP